MFEFFKKKEPEKKLPQTESAWIGLSSTFNSRDFSQYNPDSLIGRQGFGIYKKMMKDEQVKAVVKFRRDAITSRDWYFEVDDVMMDSEERKKRISIMGSIIEQMDKPKFFDAINGIMTATFNGYSMTEKTFKQIEYNGKTWWGIKRLRLKPFDTFYFTTDEFGELIKVTQKISGKEHEIDINNFLHFVQNPDVDEHYGSSELREVYRAYHSKEHAWKYRMIWLERHAGGFKWIQPKDGTTLTAGSATFTALQDVLQRSTVGSSAILPSGVELHFEWPQANVDFGTVIKDSDLAIAKGLLVPNLLGVTPEVGVGSLARAETQLDAFMWTLDADAGRLEEALNDGVFEEVSALNFGGDPEGWPRLRFKPLSDDAKMQIVTKWTELVKASVVTKQPADEAYVRDLMDFPELNEALVQDPEDIAADKEKTNNQLNPEVDEDGNPIPPQDGKPVPPKPGETVVGKDGKISIDSTKGKMSRSSRIEFQMLGRRSEDIVEVGTNGSTAIVSDMVRDIVGQIDDVLGDADVTEEDDDNPDTIQALESVAISGTEKQKLKRALRGIMRSAWDLGVRHAESEITRARNTKFSADKHRLDFVRQEFFDLRSFVATGRVVDEIMAVAESVILQAAKAGRSSMEIRKELVSQLASKGLIGEPMIVDLLGATLTNIKSPNARLATMIRTTVFEAINESRFAAFTDPDLEGFIDAFEYSSILDLRTTEVCKHMDGRIFKKDSEVWVGPTSWRPPNHFNCRSLLIPVTVDEEYSESPYPTTTPMAGFG